MRAIVDAARARAPTPSRARRGGDRKRRTPPVTILAAARGNVRVDAMAIGGGHTHHHNHHHDHGHGWFKSRAARDLEKWHKTQEGRAALELADVLETIGELNMEQSQFDTALSDYKSALKLLEEKKPPRFRHAPGQAKTPTG